MKGGGGVLALFAKNPKGLPVGSTKNRTTIDVFLPVISVAAVDKSDESKKKKNHQEEQKNIKKRCTNYHYAENLPP